MPAGRPKGYPRSGGRKKGAPNHNTTALKEMVLAALHEQGGVKYLTNLAETNSGAFASLLGRILPMQITGEDGGALIIRWQEKPD
jgi:hypothetical protein